MLPSIIENQKRCLAILLVALLSFTLSAPYGAAAAAMPIKATNAVKAKINSPYRLNDSIHPQTYEITIEPDFSNLAFSGSETIAIDKSDRSQSITLNAAELEIINATISGANGKDVQVAKKIAIDGKYEQATLTFAQALNPGHYNLHLTFKGRFNDKLHGLYASYYKDEAGNKQMIATTQFESADARRMFPCFDEPAFKATFKLNAVIDPSFSAVSNAAVAKTTIDAKTGKKIVEFAATPKMSTYLLALIVGKLEATDPVVVNGVSIRVWATPGKSHLGLYARQVAARILPYYESYFHFPYPEKKLDIIAIPDFAAGAMENLGAITFRQAKLLIDESSASLASKQTVTGYLAHEMAHLWFGDLVTMQWWDDVWLNEAFATWMSQKAIEHLMPNWHTWDEFGIWRAKAMTTDALLSTRPVCFHVTNPGEVEAMFDDITYDKGCAVIAMLESYVGSAVFQKGVDSYIFQHAFANASTRDFWQAIQVASAQPIVQIMQAWVAEPGYPLLAADLSADGKMHVGQSRFLLSGKPSGSVASQLWMVPMAIKTFNGNGAYAKKDLLKGKDQSFSVAGSAGPFIANANGTGYYSVRYSDHNLQLLKPIVESKLNAAERLALLRDEWSEALAGVVPVEQYLDITSCYRQETDPAPMSMLIEQLEYLNGVIGEKSKAAFARFVQNRLQVIKNKLGWTAQAHDSDSTRQLRADVMETLGTIGQDADVIAQAQKLFQQYRSSANTVDPDLVPVVTNIVAYNGGQEEYAAIKEMWKQAKLPEDEMRNLNALAYFQKPELISETMNLCLSPEVRAQDGPNVIGSVLKNPAGTNLAWKMVEQNWKQIISVFSFHLIPDRIVESVRKTMNTPDQESDLRAFLANNPIQSGASSYARTLEQVHTNVVFNQQSGARLASWLNRTFP